MPRVITDEFLHDPACVAYDDDAPAIRSNVDPVERLAANVHATAADIATPPTIDTAHGDESGEAAQTRSTATPVAQATGRLPRRKRRSVGATGVKIPRFTKLKYDPEAERRAHAAAVEQWRVEYPHLAAAYDAGTSFGRGGRIKPGDFERIARGHPQRRGKGRGENRDALSRSPTGGGRFVDGGEADWSDRQSATLSDDSWNRESAGYLDDPMYDPGEDQEQE